MRWKGRRVSTNVENRRGVRGAGVATGGIGTIIVIGLMLWMSGGDPQILIDSGVLDQVGAPGDSRPDTPAELEASEFVGVVLADTEDVWHQLFQQQGAQYVEPKLNLFRGRVQSACGSASAAVGPFYCPGDQDVYLDLSFFDELQSRFGAPGDFAQAYVIAHEIGHHVQNLTGVMQQGEEDRRRGEDANQISVRTELQADYLAGVWTHHVQRTKKILEPNDIDEALNAANAIGDDNLQRQTQGEVVPDSFTHGTSAQRIRWFRRGYETGDFPAAKQLFEIPYGQL